MKTIAIIITKSEIGGAQTWVYELKEILKIHYNIYLIVSDSGWLTSKFNEDKIKIIPEIAKLTSLTASYKIAKFLKKISADIVISNSAGAGVHARVSKLFYKHKHIYVSHGWSCIYNAGKFQSIYCKIEQILSYLTDQVLCVSNKDKINAINIIKINANKIITIRNCIIPLQKKSSINQRKKFIFVGRLTHPKRPDLFINISKKFPQNDFYIVGDGNKKKKLEDESANINNLFFLGEIQNFNSFNEYDVFVLCSDSEGLPMSALEAASAGLPLLLSNVGGCSELIHSDNNKQNGILFTNSVESLTDAAQKILDNYDMYFKNAKNIIPEFDIANSKDEYINIIEGKI